ncbi:FecR domain-containing protein [Planctomicrobium sp. SH661]|uniref:FecR domain-containing protein n=1 Tax=Planctomicrobium sp. SH661 TaxID=3448124 RepID=UPI003F5BB66B
MMAPTEIDFPSRQSIRHMTERMLLGEMEREEFEHFETLLLEDPAARLVYLEHLQVHAQLGNQQGAVRSLKSGTFLDRSEHPVSWHWVFWLTLAACILVLGVFSAFHEAPAPNALPIAGDAVRSRQILGRMLLDTRQDESEGTAQSIWTRESLHIECGVPLAFGQEIREIRLRNGVRCSLQGPARFTFNSLSELKLDYGTIVATVPEQAVGFTVVTSDLRVVDLGTTFGVSMSQDGHFESHVFRGLISISPMNPNLGTSPVQVQAGESVRVDVRELQVPLEPHQNQAQVTRQVLQVLQESDAPSCFQCVSRLYGIRELTGQLEYLPEAPASVMPGKLSSDQSIRIFREHERITLTKPLRVVPPDPATYAAPEDLRDIELPAGTQCTSYFLHCDLRTGRAVLEGTVRFDRPIVGVTFDTRDLAESDSIFGLSGVEYPSAADVLEKGMSRGSVVTHDGKIERFDSVKIHEDRHTVTVNMQAIDNYIDQLRILTEAP